MRDSHVDGVFDGNPQITLGDIVEGQQNNTFVRLPLDALENGNEDTLRFHLAFLLMYFSGLAEKKRADVSELVLTLSSIGKLYCQTSGVEKVD